MNLRWRDDDAEMMSCRMQPSGRAADLAGRVLGLAVMVALIVWLGLGLGWRFGWLAGGW